MKLDTDTFEAMYIRLHSKAYALARNVTRDDGKAEDAIQAAAEYITNKLPCEVTDSYWCQLVKNRALDLVRNETRRRYREAPVGDSLDLTLIEGETIRRSLRRRNKYS